MMFQMERSHCFIKVRYLNPQTGKKCLVKPFGLRGGQVRRELNKAVSKGKDIFCLIMPKTNIFLPHISFPTVLSFLTIERRVQGVYTLNMCIYNGPWYCMDYYTFTPPPGRKFPKVFPSSQLFFSKLGHDSGS